MGFLISEQFCCFFFLFRFCDGHEEFNWHIEGAEKKGLPFPFSLRSFKIIHFYLAMQTKQRYKRSTNFAMRPCMSNAASFPARRTSS